MKRAIAALAMLATILAACATGSGAGSPAVRGASSSPSASSGMASAAPTGSAGPGLTGDPLHALQLLDVTDDQVLTLGSLAAQRPVLLETMAIWCTNCRMQQDQVKAAHATADFISISLDVDPTELPGDLKSYATQHGYDWHFAKATAAVATELRDRFGTAVLNPPSTPKILLRPDGSITALDFNRIYAADDLAALVNGG
jgi:predicted small secreted protein